MKSPRQNRKDRTRSRATIAFLGLWGKFHNPEFKGVDFDPLLAMAGTKVFKVTATSRSKLGFQK